MNSFRLLNRSLIVSSFLMITISLFAQNPVKKNYFEPHSGQEGKDVIWVPTPQTLVDKMLDMAKLTSADYVMDLGSGDGRLVITAAKRGATALCVEYNPDMVELSTSRAAEAGVSDRAKFIKADLFETDLSRATVITLFLMTDLNVRLRPKLLELKPGTRIVSNTFSMEEWTADETFNLQDDCSSWCKALLWIVPAKIDGKWKFYQGGELIISQEFQMINGKLKTGNNTVNLNGKLKGTEISFTADNANYTGLVSGNRMQGTFVKDGVSKKWSATR